MPLPGNSNSGDTMQSARRQIVAIDRAGAQRAVKLNCNFAANPFKRNAILQLEWLKDGRKINTSNYNQERAPKRQQHYVIERANHLHMSPEPFPVAAAAKSSLQQQQQLRKPPMDGIGAQSSPETGHRLFASSSLTILAPVMSIDSAQYSCQWRLIPHAQAQQQPASTLQTGNSLDTIQLVVSEGKSSLESAAAAAANIATTDACHENLRLSRPLH